MALKPPSKQKLLYRRAWSKAYASDEGLQLHFKTKAGAFEARRHLYEAVRDVKENPMEFPPELVKAAEEIQIVWAGDTSLHMRHRSSNDATRGMEEALGESVDKMVDADAIASAERLMKELGNLMPAAQPEHKGTDKFYEPRKPFTGEDDPETAAIRQGRS